MKILGRYFYFVMSPHKISKEQRQALAKGVSHLHANPIRKNPTKKELIRLIEEKNGEAK